MTSTSAAVSLQLLGTDQQLAYIWSVLTNYHWIYRSSDGGYWPTVSLYLVSIDQVLGDVDLEFVDSDLYLVSIEEELVNIYLQMISTNQLLAYIWSVMTMT